MSSSQNGSGDSPFGVSNPTPQGRMHSPQGDVNESLRGASLQAQGFPEAAASVAQLPRDRQTISPAAMMHPVYNPHNDGYYGVGANTAYQTARLAATPMDFNTGNVFDISDAQAAVQSAHLFLDPRERGQAFRTQYAREMEDHALNTMRLETSADEFIGSVGGDFRTFLANRRVDVNNYSAVAGGFADYSVSQAGEAAFQLQQEMGFNFPETYSQLATDIESRTAVTTRAELATARGAAKAYHDVASSGLPTESLAFGDYQREFGDIANPLSYSDTPYSQIAGEQVLVIDDPNYEHPEGYSDRAIGRQAVEYRNTAANDFNRQVRSEAALRASTLSTFTGTLVNELDIRGQDAADYTENIEGVRGNVLSRLFNPIGGQEIIAGGGDGFGGGGGGGMMGGFGGGDDGGRPRLDLSVVQGQLDTLGATHLQNFATALSDATNQLQLYTGGLPTAAGGQGGGGMMGGQGGAMANAFNDPRAFFGSMQMSMSNALDDIFRDENGELIFANMQQPQGQVAPLALPAPESAYDEQRNRSERNRQRREANRRAGRPEDEGVERVRAGDLFKGLVGGFLGRQSVAGDKAEVRQAAAGGGLLKTLFDKTVGVAFGVGAATDIPSAISALPGGSLLAAPFGVLDKYGRQGAAFELPALQASMTRGSGFYNQSPTSTKFYEGQIKTLSTQLGITPEAAANLLRDVGAGSRNAMGVTDIKNLMIRGYDPTAISGMIGNVRGANAGGALDVLGTMGAATNLRLDARGNIAVEGGRRLSNAEVMAFTQGSADFAIGRRMSGFGGSTSATSRQALGMMRAGDTSLTANLQTMGRFQGVGVGASKGITAFATGMLDMALQAYAMDQAGGDPIAAQRILEDLSADPYAMRQALASLGIDETQIDTMMLGTGGLTTRDVERSKMPAAELDLKEAKSKLGTGGTGASLQTSRALAKRSQDELERLYKPATGGSLADKFTTYMDQTVKFQEAVLNRIPNAKQMAKINAKLIAIYEKMDILVELEKALVSGETKILGAENPVVKRYGNSGVVKRGRGSILSGGANITTGNR